MKNNIVPAKYVRQVEAPSKPVVIVLKSILFVLIGLGLFLFYQYFLLSEKNEFMEENKIVLVSFFFSSIAILIGIIFFLTKDEKPRPPPFYEGPIIR